MRGRWLPRLLGEHGWDVWLEPLESVPFGGIRQFPPGELLRGMMGVREGEISVTWEEPRFPFMAIRYIYGPLWDVFVVGKAFNKYHHKLIPLWWY